MGSLNYNGTPENLGERESDSLKAVPYFSKNYILDVWQGSEYATELAFKVKDVSKSNQFERQV